MGNLCCYRDLESCKLDIIHQISESEGKLNVTNFDTFLEFGNY